MDKSGCIQFGGKRYEIGVLLVGRTVDVAYDLNDIETLTVEHNGKSWRVWELQIGEHTGPRSKLQKLELLEAYTRIIQAEDEDTRSS